MELMVRLLENRVDPFLLTMGPSSLLSMIRETGHAAPPPLPFPGTMR